MTDPQRTSPAREQADADSQGPLDPTLARLAAEPNFTAPAHAGEVGQLGRYRVLQKLGQGGMGAAYLGYDSALDPKVALKVMLPAHATDRGACERFLREARAAAKVHSDHVVTIHDVGEERTIPFIAMEYLLGSPLDQFLKTKGDLPLPQALRVVRETALGLSAAHELGMIHRDIKPGNIWLEAPKGRVKILDFGLARAQNDDAHLTGSGAVVGTPAYMSPEQGRGQKVDHRSDLFSLGVMLYRLVTGRMPFVGDSTMAVLTSLAVDTPVPPRQHNPQLPESLEAVINKLLAKNPAERFQIARDVVDALAEIEQPRSGSGPLPVVVATPVPSLAVGVQTQNVWEGIDASDSVPVPLATSAEAPADVPIEPKPQGQARRLPKWSLFAALAALLAAVAVVAVVVVSLPKKPEAVQKEDPPDKPRQPGPKKDDKDKQPTATAAGTVHPYPSDFIPPMTPVKPAQVFALDFLDPANPKHVPPGEKYDWQPKELVAVLGSHRQRLIEAANWLHLGPDGKTVLAGTAGPRWAIDVATGRLRDWPALAALSPDGKRAAYSNKVWELADLKKSPVEYALQGDIVEFLTADTILVAGEGKYVAWKLAPEGLRPQWNFPDPYSWAVSNDRKRLAVAGKDQSCRVFDITPDGPKEKFALPEPDGKVFTAGVNSCRLSFSDTGLLATVDPAGSVRVWDVSGPAVRLRHTIDEKSPAAVALFPKGDRVVRGTDSAFAVWSLEGERSQKLATAPPFGNDLRSVVITPDGNTIVTGHYAGVVRFWGVEKGVIFEKNPLKPQPMVDHLGDFSTDGQLAALHHEDGRSYVWGLGELRSGPLDGPRDAVARFSPDGTSFCASAPGGQIRLAPLFDRPGAVPVEFAKGFSPACYSPDGKWLVANSDAALAIWDVSVSPPKELFDRVPRLGTNWWRCTPDGRFLIAGGGTGGAVRVWAVTKGGLVPRFDTAIPCAHFVVSPDGKTVVGCQANVRIAFYDLADGVLAFRREEKIGAGWVDFSPDGRTLLVGGGYAGLKLLDAASGKILRERALQGAPLGGRFHPDGRHVFVTNADKTTYILRLPKEVLERSDDPDRRAAEYVLSIGGAVGINGEQFARKGRGALPKESFRLTLISLRDNPKVTDADLAACQGCRNLLVLDLFGTPTGDAGLVHFKDCTNLEKLYLERTKVTDTGLAALKGLKNLTVLLLAETKVTDAGISHFGDCQNLLALNLANTATTDAGASRFAGCQNLEILYLNGTKVTDTGFATLKNLPNLRYLELVDTQVTDERVEQLKSYERLRVLFLNGTKISAKGVGEIARAHPLCRIVSDGGLVEPATEVDRKTAEAVLSIGGTVRVYGADRDIKDEKELPRGSLRLTSIDLRQNARVTDAALAAFQTCLNLAFLDLSETAVTDAGLAKLQDSPNLTTLRVQKTKVTDKGVKDLASTLARGKIEWDGGVIGPKK